MVHALTMADRERAGHGASPTATAVAAQTARSAGIALLRSSRSGTPVRIGSAEGTWSPMGSPRRRHRRTTLTRPEEPSDTARLKEAGLHHLRLHDARYTTAQLAVDAGIGLDAVGRLLGHASAVTTRRYAKPGSEAAALAADVVGNIITLVPKTSA